MPVIDIAYPQLTYGSMDRTEMVIKENSLLNQTTMLSEYWDHYVLLNPHNNLKNQKKLREEKDVDHITVVMLGDSYEEENQLSIDEINSIALLNSSFKNELKRAKNIQNFSSGYEGKCLFHSPSTHNIVVSTGYYIFFGGRAFVRTSYLYR